MSHRDAHALFSLQNLLDYEVDSDDEWEEEEPGESLSHSEGVSNPSGDEWHQLYQLKEPLYSWLMWGAPTSECLPPQFPQAHGQTVGATLSTTSPFFCLHVLLLPGSRAH